MTTLNTGLPISRYVSVQVSLTSPATIAQAINSCIIIGSSEVIDAGERKRDYANISEVANDFGTTAPEYLAAELWFSQNPQPDNLMIGRWVQTADGAFLLCGILSPAEQIITNWTSITNGRFTINVSAANHQVTGLDFSLQTNMNGIASVINAALTAATIAAQCVWNGNQFVFETTATGVLAAIGYMTDGGGAGTYVGSQLKGDQANADRISNGAAPETALAAVVAIDSMYSSQFYGVIVLSTVDTDHEQVAAYIEACDPPHFYGVTTQDENTLDPVHNTDLASVLQGFGYNKTAIQLSSSTPYVIASFLGRILTTQWGGSNTTITLMYKREPGVSTEALSTNQADALEGKNCNVYAHVANGADIVQYGFCCSGEWVDTIIGADALALEVQAALFNTLYTTNTKVPQTDTGMHILLNSASAVCARYVQNGYLAPGTWNAPGFGTLNQGDLIPLGYYLFAPSMNTQDPADRALRKAPLIQIAAKCAGAIHLVDVLIFVNQ